MLSDVGVQLMPPLSAYQVGLEVMDAECEYLKVFFRHCIDSSTACIRMFN